MKITANRTRPPFRHALLATGALFFCTPLAAQEATEKTPLDDLVEYIENGDRDAAVRLVARVESLSGLPRIVTTPAAFVDRMLGCSMTDKNSRQFGIESTSHRTTWQCEDGEYRVDFFTLKDKPYVEVAEFADAERVAELKANIARPSMPPPAPPFDIKAFERNRAKQKAMDAKVCNALGEAVVSGSAEGLADFTNEKSRFAFGFYNPFTKATMVESDGDGPAAAQPWVDYVRETLGAPNSFTCDNQMLKLDLGRSDRTGFAFFGSWQDAILSVDMRYATREKLLKARSEAIEAGLVEP